MVMGNTYGTPSHKVTAADVSSLDYTNMTVQDSGNDNWGNYFAKMQFDTGGCGGASGGFRVDINNLVGSGWRWEYITFKWTMAGVTSCWNFNSSSDYGSAGTNGLELYNGLNYPAGSISGTTLEGLSTDKVFFCQNTFNTAYDAGYNAVVMSRCDNDVNYNVFHSSYAHSDGLEKYFYMRRRRTSSTGVAGPSHSRSCNATGSGAWAKVSDIVVFRNPND
jgi:hypothetical protein